MNLSTAHLAALAACTVLLLMYTVFVASECRAHWAAEAADSIAKSLRSGEAVAIGTGLWAVQVLVSITHGAHLADNGLLLIALAWVASVAAAVALLHGFRPRLSVATAAGVLVSSLLLAGSHGLTDAAHEGVVRDIHYVEAIAASMAISVFTMIATRGSMGEARRLSSIGRVGAALMLGALAGAQIVVGGSLLGEPLAASPTPQPVTVPTLALAALVVIAALAALTVARLAVRMRQHYKAKAGVLSGSLHEANQNLRKLAYRDPLTRLSNRVMFEKKMASLVAAADAESGRLTLMFIDLDGFKPINDGHGHGNGDKVLRAVGDRLRQAAPKGCTVSRIGGDEFAVLVPGSLNTGEASMLASRFLVALKAPFALDAVEVGLSASIGIAYYPDCGAADRLLACGDAAMYAAKRSGGSGFAFHEQGMESAAAAAAELTADLRRALELKQFELHYQPKIDARSGRVTALEALLRWNHPTRGLVSPDVFIPLCERAGLIGAVGDWVIDRACGQMSRWQRSGVLMRVAINLSARQLKQPGLVGRVEQLLQRHGVAARNLTFEITESVAMADERDAHRMLTRLGRLGVKISIDDFGAGYSSLSRLRQLPASELKIDRSFVTDVATSNDARAIVQAVIQMAHALELRVVAEGVETAAQRDALLALGCDEFQGYLFAKPLPADTVLRWAVAERPKPRSFSPSLFMKSVFASLD
jgi:diguanylate cyclase